MHKRGVSYHTIGLLLLAVFLSVAYAAVAKSKKEAVRWEYHKSISGAFDARFLSNYKIKSSPLRIDDKVVLFRVEIFAEIEDEDNPKAPSRNYSIKVDQTLGSVIGASKTQDLLARDVLKYKKATRALGAKLESQQDVNSDGFVGKEFMFSFVQDGVVQGIRAKVMYTDVSRVEAVLAGPESSMYSFKSNEFFNSLKLYDGNAKIDGKVGDGWKEYESPLGLFTLVVPDENNTFSLGPPKFSTSEKKEQGRYVFKDPVLLQRTMFNFYGYQIQQEKKFDDVKVLLYAEHVSKYLPNFRLQDLKFDERMSADGTYGILSTKVRLRGLEKYPHVTAILIQALFNKDGVVVLEYMGSHEQVESPLGKTLFSLVKFHPEKSYHKEKPASDGSSASSDEPEDPEEEAHDQDDAAESSDAGSSGDVKEKSSADVGDTEDKQTLKASIKLGDADNPEAKETEEKESEAVDPEGKEPQSTEAEVKEPEAKAPQEQSNEAASQPSPTPQKKEQEPVSAPPTSIDPRSIKIKPSGSIDAPAEAEIDFNPMGDSPKGPQPAPEALDPAPVKQEPPASPSPAPTETPPKAAAP